MESWEQPIKLEESPAESFISTPGNDYPSLFDTMNPTDMISPESLSEDLANSETPAPDTPAGDGKKATKKRKSWGQVLPEPKTNLPPRKRAKTEDEKEQRRVERVLRNRRAAQSSRERKRQEVEALEKKNKELEDALNHARQANMVLAEELKKLTRRSNSPFDSFHSGKPITLSPDLFGSQEERRSSTDSSKSSLIDELMNSTQSHSNTTVNPASLSPSLTPVPEGDEAETQEDDEAEPSVDISSDLTQRPAAMLCDLQCHQSEEMSQTWLASQSSQRQTWAFFLHLQILTITSAAFISACQRPLMQIALSLKAGFSLPPSQSILKTIIWLVTRPRSSRPTPSTSQSSSTTRSTLPSLQTRLWTSLSQRIRSSAAAPLTLRLKSLQKILTCSPNLARPLMDATMEALRLVCDSEGCETRAVGSTEAEGPVARESSAHGSQTWLNGNPLPSKEVLLTLLWALRVEERKLIARGALVRTPESNTQHQDTPASLYISTTTLNTPSLKRKGDAYLAENGEKRLRQC